MLCFQNFLFELTSQLFWFPPKKWEEKKEKEKLSTNTKLEIVLIFE